MLSNVLVLGVLAQTVDGGSVTAPPMIGAPTDECPPRPCQWPGFGKCGADGFVLNPCEGVREAKALRELNGFQKTEWGMNEAQVSKLYGGAKATGDKPKRVMTVKKEVAGLAADIHFIFDAEKKLVEAQVAFDDKQKGFANPAQACEAVAKALAERYGPGEESEEVLESHSVRWRGEKTLLQLDCSGVAIWPKRSVMLFYSSRAFEEARPTVKSDDL